VDVADERHAHAAADGADVLERLRTGHGDTDELATRFLEHAALRQRPLDVLGVRRGHGLDPDRVRAAEDLVADAYLARLVPFDDGAVCHGVGSLSSLAREEA